MRRCVLLLAVVVGLHTPANAAQGPVAGPVAIRPADGTMLFVEGVGPLHGAVEIRRDGTVINVVDLEDYVGGIAEVPGDWPMEALKAQAVAARTYALWEVRRGYWQRFGFDVCATTSCQVYSGALTEQGEKGRRWRQAVDATAGQVLLHDGVPALARYHASSGGRTLPNEKVYPSSGPRPYLAAVDDPGDRVSPLHTWTVRFSREQLQAVLRDAIGLAGTLTEVVADQDAREVTIRTKGGELKMSTVRFRREVSGSAPKLYPDAYPGDRADGLRMPATLPSSRFDVERADDGFVVRGRGYGHGVGMSQWGAKGRAEAGDDYREILGGYYGGLEPTSWDGAPERLRVAVRRGADAVVVGADGDFSVSDGENILAATTFGAWTFSRGAGAIRVTPSEGFDLPLILSGLDVPAEVEHEDGTPLEVAFVVPKAAEVTATVSRGDDVLVEATDVVEAGPATLALDLDDAGLGRDGTYRLRVEAFDGADRVTEDASVRITRPGSRPVGPAVVATTIALVAWLLIRRRRASGPPGGGSRVPRPQPTSVR